MNIYDYGKINIMPNGDVYANVNRQLAEHKVIIRNGAGIVDATLTDTPRCPRGRTEYELAEDRKEDERCTEEIDKEENQMRIVKKRWIVERTFGGMRRWFRCGTARYVGLSKTHTQHLLEAIAYNLYRASGIIVANCKK